MPEREVTTTHGTVEYETVACDSCDAEVAKADAHRFVLMEEVKTERSRYGCQRWEAPDRKFSTGWACPYCADEGPADFPGGRSLSLPSVARPVGMIPRALETVPRAAWRANLDFLAELQEIYDDEEHLLFLLGVICYASALLVVGSLTLSLVAAVASAGGLI